MRLKRFNWYETRQNFNKAKGLRSTYIVDTMQLWIYGFKKRRYIQGRPWIYTIAVTIAVRFHLFSYRTQKLSSLAPTILCWRRHGKIGSCCIQKERHQSLTGAFLFGSDYRCFPPSRWLGERFTVSNNVMLPLRDLQLLIMLDCLVQSEKYPRYAVIMSVSNNLHSKDIEW